MSALPVEGVVLVAAADASWLGLAYLRGRGFVRAVVAAALVAALCAAVWVVERQAPVTCACPTVENELGAVRLGALIPAFSGV